MNPREKLASTLSSRVASGGAEKGTAATDVERVRFVQRVAKAFQSAADRGGPVRLRLEPSGTGLAAVGDYGSQRGDDRALGSGDASGQDAVARRACRLCASGWRSKTSRSSDSTWILMDQSPNDSPQTRDGAADSHGPPQRRRGSELAAAAVTAPPVAAPATPGHRRRTIERTDLTQTCGSGPIGLRRLPAATNVRRSKSWTRAPRPVPQARSALQPAPATQKRPACRASSSTTF